MRALAQPRLLANEPGLKPVWPSRRSYCGRGVDRLVKLRRACTQPSLCPEDKAAPLMHEPKISVALDLALEREF